MAYTFGFGDAYAVEIPELDAFRVEFRSLCEKYGFGFNYDCHWSDYGRSHVTIVPLAEADYDFLTDDLDEYREGVPFMDTAKCQFERNKLEAKRAAQDAEWHRKREAEAKRERALKEHGVTLSDGTYRLIKA
jgi:hypothetical protein